MGAVDTLDYFGITPIAVSKGINYPVALQKYNAPQLPSSGRLFEPDLTAIEQLKPDLIVVGLRAAKHYQALTDIAPTLFFAPDDERAYWSSRQQQWRNIGAIFAVADKVEQTIAELDLAINKIQLQNQQQNADALTVLSAADKLRAFGAKSRFSAIYREFGYRETVENIDASSDAKSLSYRYIHQQQPSNLLVLDRDRVVKNQATQVREAFASGLIKDTPAYKNDRVIFLDVHAWYIALGGVNATKQMLKDLSH